MYMGTVKRTYNDDGKAQVASTSGIELGLGGVIDVGYAREGSFAQQNQFPVDWNFARDIPYDRDCGTSALQGDLHDHQLSQRDMFERQDAPKQKIGAEKDPDDRRAIVLIDIPDVLRLEDASYTTSPCLIRRGTPQDPSDTTHCRWCNVAFVDGVHPTDRGQNINWAHYPPSGITELRWGWTGRGWKAKSFLLLMEPGTSVCGVVDIVPSLKLAEEHSIPAEDRWKVGYLVCWDGQNLTVTVGTRTKVGETVHPEEIKKVGPMLSALRSVLAQRNKS